MSGDALAEIIGFKGWIEVADIGAALLDGPPAPYQRLLDLGLARLNAFDADERQHARLREAHGADLRLYGDAVGDGDVHTLYVANAASGMTSLLKPSVRHLEYFNGFGTFGEPVETREMVTSRLDDIVGLPDLDFVKADVQGGELAALRHGPRRLARCVAIQLEVSFIPLYEKQPTFGDVDVWMRGQGFAPHCFAELKRWSIAPVRRNNDIRQPFNQLLEADVVYVRDPTAPELMDADQVRRLTLIAHHAYGSPDLAGRLVQALERAGEAAPRAFDRYLALLNTRHSDR